MGVGWGWPLGCKRLAPGPQAGKGGRVLLWLFFDRFYLHLLTYWKSSVAATCQHSCRHVLPSLSKCSNTLTHTHHGLDSQLITITAAVAHVNQLHTHTHAIPPPHSFFPTTWFPLLDLYLALFWHLEGPEKTINVLPTPLLNAALVLIVLQKCTNWPPCFLVSVQRQSAICYFEHCLTFTYSPHWFLRWSLEVSKSHAVVHYRDIVSVIQGR